MICFFGENIGLFLQTAEFFRESPPGDLLGGIAQHVSRRDSGVGEKTAISSMKNVKSSKNPIFTIGNDGKSMEILEL